MAPGEKPDGGVIYPTLTCFDDAFEIVLGIAQENKGRAWKLVIVHALCLFPDEKLAAHAWVEEGTKVYFAGMYLGEKTFFQVERPEYYAQVRPQEMTRYRVAEIFRGKKAGDRMHTGPWEPGYQPYLRDAQKEER